MYTIDLSNNIIWLIYLFGFQLIGQSIGQRFRKEVHIGNLPMLKSVPKNKQSSLLDTHHDSGIINLYAENTIS